MDALWSNIFHLNSDEESLVNFLAKLPVFHELEKRDLRQLEQLVHLRNYHSHETIFETGDPGTGMYIIRSGNVMIFTRDIHNNKHEMALLGPGDIFGETTLAAPAPRTFSARTTVSSELIGLFRTDLLTTATKRPETACRILFGLSKVISERLQRAAIELRALQQLNDTKEQ